MSDEEDNITSMARSPKKAGNVNMRDGRPAWKNVADALRDALYDIETGVIEPNAIVIMMRCEHKFEDASKQKFLKTSYPHWVMGLNELELLGLLDHEQHWWNTRLLS